MSPLSQLWRHTSPQQKWALVFGGGGARGALQVDALRTLYELGIGPDVWVGTSIGAATVAYLAVRGVNLRTLNGLETTWQDAATADLLPANYLWLSARILFDRVGIQRHKHRLPGT